MKILKGNSIAFAFLLLVLDLFLCSYNSSAQQGNSSKDSLEVTRDTVVATDTIVIEQVKLDTLTIIDSLDNVDPTAVNPKKTDIEIDARIERQLREIYNQVPLTYNKRVKGFIDYFTGRNRNYLLIMERRKKLYFPIFEEMLKKYKMPDEIKYLPIVESGLNPMAISRAGAAGLWQFMPGTGKEMGLIVSDYIDERLDPHKSTEAACKFLLRLYRAFGDWELALASYNCGPGVVKRASRQSGRSTFWKMYDYLPAETRGYVPQFVAVTYTMNHLTEYDMVGDSILYPMETDTILLRQFVNLLILCEKLNFCYEDFVKLNPAIRTNVLPDNVNYPIRLPKEKKLEFLLNQHEIMECVNVVTTPIEVTTADRRRASSGAVVYRQKIVHTVRQGEVLGRIAGKYGISVAQVRSWNNLKGNTIRVGQKLLIYRMKYTRSKSSTAIKKESSYNRMQTKTSAAKTGKPRKYYYVQPGDTLWTISKKCGGISVERLKQLNNIKGSTIKVGQKLILG